MLEVLLEDDFWEYSCESGRLSKPCHLILTQSFLDVYDNTSNRNALVTFNISDVVGSTVARTPQSSYMCFKLHICRISSSLRGIKHRKLETVIFCYNKHSTFEENETVVDKWRFCITSLVRGEPSMVVTDKCLFSSLEAKLLVLVNPKSGVGTAVKMFESSIAKMFNQAALSFDVVVTKHQGHAQNYLVNLPSLDAYQGIVVISGDGLLFEVYNGLLQRKDSDVALSKPVGIIPQGSGNGLARSLAHFTREPYLRDPVLSSTLNVIPLKTVPCDLAIITLADNTKLCSFLSIGWGLMADIDIESERLRSIGEARFTVWAVARLLRLRTYQARLSYLPAKLTEVTEMSPLPPLSEPLTDDWVVVEGTFVCIYAGLQPYLGTDLFFAPNSHIHDGIMWLLVVQAPVSKLQLSQLLLSMSDGSHTNMPWLKFVPVTAFRLEPRETAGPKAHLTVDGENITAQALQVQVLNGAGNVFMR